MNAITTILQLGSNKHCFLERTASYQYKSGNTPSPRDDGILVYEISGDSRKGYFSTRGSCGELVSGDTVQINGLYGSRLGLVDDEPLMLKRIKSTLSCARKVNVEPLSPDDWEILEQNSGRVETVLLDQIRVIWPDQVFPIWVQRSVCVFMKITAVEPMSCYLLLDNNTEVMVAPKTRLYNPPRSLGIRGMPNTPPPFSSMMSGQNKASPPPIQKRSPTPSSLQSATPTKAKSWFQEDEKSSSRENLDTLEPRPVLRSPSRSPRNTLKRSGPRQRGSFSDPFSERQPKQSLPRPMLRRESSLMESVMKVIGSGAMRSSRYVFSIMGKEDEFDRRSESDTSSGIDLSSQNLPPRSGVLRVQPMKLSSSIEECSPILYSTANNATHSRKWPSSSSLSSSSSSRNVLDNTVIPNLPYELFQPSTVYVDANSTQIERELHPYLPRLPNNFIARLQRLPSPQEKAESAQKASKKQPPKDTTTTTTSSIGPDKTNPHPHPSSTTGPNNPASSSNKKSEEINKANSGSSSNSSSNRPSSVSASDQDAQISASCFVRVVVIDRKAALTDEAWTDAADALLSQQPLMNGHLIVPDLLRRQLRLDSTGSVWLQTGPIDIVIPKKVVVYQLAPVSFRITNDILEKAFRAYIKLCADAEHPLILFQGLFIKYPVLPDLTVEVQLTFFGENDVSNPKAVSMLSVQNIDSVMVCMERVAKVDKMGVINPTLTYSKVSDFDTQPPTVKLKHLGGTEKVAKTGLAFLQACVGSRPLSQETFRPRRGLCNGCLLITGPRGSGKSSLAKALCRKMSQIPTMAHITLVDCKSLRGKTVSHIQKILETVFDEAAWREPSVIVLDNLDVIVAAATGPEGEMNAEALYAAKNSQALQGLIKYEMENNSCVAVIATATSKSSIHPTLVSHSGVHYFQVTLNIGSPDKEGREKILTCILQQHSSVSNETLKTVNLRPLASSTEGYVARDLEVLVNRAVHHRLTCDRDAHMSKITLTQEDFEQAQEKFKPVSIRGVALHKAGDLGWADIGGLEDVKKALVETLRWPAKYPRLFSSCPLRLRSGILLYGAPGTGKTLLAGVVAKECGLNFISIKGPELLSKYIGASEQAVRDLFTRAMSAKPCILFFDEFDSIAPKRGHDSTGVTDRVVNQFLTQLDGVEGLDGVYVLAATSRPDLIDSALLRPGRLDKSLQCPVPIEEERYYILEALTRKMCLAYDVDLMEIATLCPFFTGADLKAVLYNAQLKAIHENARMEPILDETVLRIKGDDDHCPAIRQATKHFSEDFHTKLTIAREKSLSEKNSPTKTVDSKILNRKASGTSEDSATSSEVATEDRFASGMSGMSKDVKDTLMKGLSDLLNNPDEDTGSSSVTGEETDSVKKTMDENLLMPDTMVKEQQSRVLYRAPIHSIGFDTDGFLPSRGDEDNDDDDDDGFRFNDDPLTPLSERSKSSSSDRSWVPLTASSPIYRQNGGKGGEGMEVTSPILPENLEGELVENHPTSQVTWGEGGETSIVPSLHFHSVQNGGGDDDENEADDDDDEDDDTYEETVINKGVARANKKKLKDKRLESSSSMNLGGSDPSLTYPPHTRRKRSYERTQSHPAQMLDVVDGGRLNKLPASIEKPVTVFTSLEHGLATLSPEDEARYLAMVHEIRRRDDRLFEAANNKRRTSLMVSKPSNALMEVCQRHLLEAVRESRPSVTVNDRRKYDTIYNKFVASRTADFSRDRVDGPSQKRATLA